MKYLKEGVRYRLTRSVKHSKFLKGDIVIRCVNTNPVGTEFLMELVDSMYTVSGWLYKEHLELETTEPLYSIY